MTQGEWRGSQGKGRDLSGNLWEGELLKIGKRGEEFITREKKKRRKGGRNN